MPGARYGAMSWTDTKGAFWMFGGMGYGASTPVANASAIDDLWRYASGQWTWVAGSSNNLAPPVYGTKGSPDPSNTPGARSEGACWTDASGKLWLFGGNDYRSPFLNDLWSY
jgi:hypothetical protein